MKYRRLDEQQQPNKFSFDPMSLSADDLKLLYKNGGYHEKVDLMAMEYLGFHKNSHVYAVLVTDEEDLGDDNIYGTKWYVQLGPRGLQADIEGDAFLEDENPQEALSRFERYVRMVKSKK